MGQPKPKRHYHVLVGLQGLYMPNSNNVHMSRRSAEQDAAWQAREARDNGDKVQGSARSGYITLSDPKSAYLGEYECIEITECHEADCLECDGE